jgi:hypothetical protein
MPEGAVSLTKTAIANPPQQLNEAATPIILYAMATMDDNYSSADERQHPQNPEQGLLFPISHVRPARLNA